MREKIHKAEGHMLEIRKIDAESLRKLCVARRWYTRGDNAAYNHLLNDLAEGKENITGYQYESWHYRYVGVDIATYIHENNITFEEYYEMFIANKK